MLVGKKLYIRPLEPNDIDILYDWENDPANWKVSNTLKPFSKSLLQKYIDSVADIFEVKQVRFIICLRSGDKPIGTIDLFDYEPFHQRAGLGVLIGDKEERNKGYAQEALNLAITYSFDVLALLQLYCNVECDNDKSIRLFKKVGFNITGSRKNWVRSGNDWIDVYFLQLMNPEFLGC